MSEETRPNSSRTPKKQLHIHVPSLQTNTSGRPESTITNASDFSYISQFPAPPAQVPTPTLSSSTTPTTSRFADRFTPTVPDYKSAEHFALGTPSTPRSPVNLQFSGNAKDDNGIGHSHYAAQVSQHRDWTAMARPPAPVARTENIRSADVMRNGSESSLGSQRPIGPRRPSLKDNNRQLPQWQAERQQTPVSLRAPGRRPASPLSTVAPSAYVDWNDAASIAPSGISGISGISVNPSEEALLTTSFITSLLSNSPEPFPDRKLSDARRKLVRQLDKSKSETSSQVSSGSRHRAAAASADTHQSIPASVAPYHPSDLGVPADVPITAKLPPSFSDQDHDAHSITQPSTVGHSDDGLLQLVTRKPSISYVLGGPDNRPVGVVPAYRVSISPSDASNRMSFTSGRTGASSTISSKPPVHRADAPRDVTHGFDHEDRPRESDEDLARLGAADLIVGGPEGPTSPALPSTAGSKSRFSVFDSRLPQPSGAPPTPINQKENRSNKGVSLQRTNSHRSVVSSLISRISHASAAQRDKYMAWMRNRPLPPLPPIPNNLAPQFPNGREIQIQEEHIPLPNLARRADHLQALLNRGRYPPSSGYNSQYEYKEHLPMDDDYRKSGGYSQIMATGTDGTRLSVFSRFRKNKVANQYSDSTSPTSPKIMTLEQKKKRRRKWIIILCVVVGIILVIAIPVAIVKSRKDSLPNCPGNLTGASCTLDATCVCTASSGSCKPLANTLNLLVPSVNSIFAANFTASQISDAVTSVVGSGTSNLCAKQALLVDVEPALDSASAPNRTLWAQSAILWNLGMSQDISATQTLQKFVSSAPWSTVSSSDGATSEVNAKFAVQASGYTFDFAKQVVSPLSASFKDSSPSDAQVAEVPDGLISTLDRMYSFAIASSTQRSRALQNYWTDVLQQQQSDLENFQTAVQNSMFLLPFDATSSPGGLALTTFMTNTSSTVFPPPISCFPGLNSTQLDRINSIETTVFGLNAASAASDFNTACFPTRPVYGVVDILRQRLPFPDARQGVGLQAAALSQDAKIRVVMYSGEALSALPDASGLPSFDSFSTDPREFGTRDFMDHVLLNYFSSIANTTLVNQLVSFVLSSSSSPPGNDTDLGEAISSASFPILEFALFGAVKPSDIANAVSSFSTPSGALFFGSDAGQTFREWVFANTSAQIAWAEKALSAEVVQEGEQQDENFESVWTPASELVGQGETNESDVEKVVSSLESLGLFSS